MFLTQETANVLLMCVLMPVLVEFIVLVIAVEPLVVMVVLVMDSVFVNARAAV